MLKRRVDLDVQRGGELVLYRASCVAREKRTLCRARLIQSRAANRRCEWERLPGPELLVALNKFQNVVQVRLVDSQAEFRTNWSVAA